MVQVLEQNRRRQAQNSAPRDFPSFARQGFDIKILADGYSTSNGLIYKVQCLAEVRASVHLLPSMQHLLPAHDHGSSDMQVQLW